VPFAEFVKIGYNGIMFLDVAVGVIIILFVAFGAMRGFLRSLLGMIPTVVVIIGSILLARPLARVLDGWFGWADGLSGLFQGEGSIDTWVREQGGMLMLVIIIAVALFILLRIVLWLVMRAIMSARERSRTFSQLDSWAGFFFGFVKFAIYATMVSAVLFTLFGIIDGSQEWLFTDSRFALWIYERCIDVMGPLLRRLSAAVTGT